MWLRFQVQMATRVACISVELAGTVAPGAAMNVEAALLAAAVAVLATAVFEDQDTNCRGIAPRFGTIDA